MDLCFTPIKTERIDYRTESRTLESFLLHHVSWKVWEKSIIFLSSKIVSLFQKNVRKFSSDTEKEELAKSFWVGSWKRPNSNYPLMVVWDGWILGYAWIDDSNVGENESVLPPIQPFEVAQNIIAYLKQESHIHNLAIIITDSKSVVLRKWSVGTALAWAGCQPLKDYKGKKDLFWRTMLYTSQNIVDSLATTAVFLMGEWSESTPIVIMQWDSTIEFTDDFPDKNKLFLAPQDDMFCDAFDEKIWKEI